MPHNEFEYEYIPQKPMNIAETLHAMDPSSFFYFTQHMHLYDYPNAESFKMELPLSVCDEYPNFRFWCGQIPVKRIDDNIPLSVLDIDINKNGLTYLVWKCRANNTISDMDYVLSIIYGKGFYNRLQKSKPQNGNHLLDIIEFRKSGLESMFEFLQLNFSNHNITDEIFHEIHPTIMAFYLEYLATNVHQRETLLAAFAKGNLLNTDFYPHNDLGGGTDFDEYKIVLNYN